MMYSCVGCWMLHVYCTYGDYLSLLPYRHSFVVIMLCDRVPSRCTVMTRMASGSRKPRASGVMLPGYTAMDPVAFASR